MFLGHYIRKIDKSNRIVIPKDFVPEGVESFVIKKSYNASLVLLSPAHFNKLKEKLSRLDLFNNKNADFLRLFFAGVVNVSIDKRNRLMLPAPFLKYMQAEQYVLLIGLVNRFEMWNPEVFKSCQPCFTPANDGIYLSDDLDYFSYESFRRFCNDLRMEKKVNL